MSTQQIKPTKSITFYAHTESLKRDGMNVCRYGVRTDYEIIEGTGKDALRTMGAILAPFYSKNAKTDLYNCIPKITEKGYRKLSFNEENIFLKALKNPNNATILEKTDTTSIDLIIMSIYFSTNKKLTDKSQD